MPRKSGRSASKKSSRRRSGRPPPKTSDSASLGMPTKEDKFRAMRLWEEEHLKDPPLENPADMPCAKGTATRRSAPAPRKALHMDRLGHGLWCTLNMANVEWALINSRAPKRRFVVPVRTLLLSVCRFERLKRFALDANGLRYVTNQLRRHDGHVLHAAPRIMPYGVRPTDEEILAVGIIILKMSQRAVGARSRLRKLFTTNPLV